MEQIKIIRFAIFIIIALALISAIETYAIFTGYVVKRQESELKIGAILPLSGQFAFLGTEIQRGMELAKNENKDIDIQTIYEDDKSLDNTAIANGANKLVNVDDVDVGITAIVQESRPAAPFFNKKKKPLLVIWDSNNEIAQSGEYTFSTGFSTEKTGESIAEYAYSNLGLRRIAIVLNVEPFNEIIAESFKNKFESLGGKVVLYEKTELDNVDFKTVISKIKGLNVDGVYSPMLPPSIVSFIKQTKELNLNAQILAGDPLTQDSINELGSATDGIYYTNYFSDDSEGLKLKYINEYGEEPIDISLVSFGYNGVKTVVNAYRANPDLEKGMYKVIGPTRTVDKVERIYRIENGKAILVKN